MASIPVVQHNIKAPLAQAKEPDPSLITAASSNSLFLAHDGSSFVSLENTRSNTHHLIWRLEEIPRQKDFVVAIYTSSNPEGYYWHYENSPTPRVVLKKNGRDRVSFKENTKNWFKYNDNGVNNDHFSLEIYDQPNHLVRYIPDELDTSHAQHQDYLDVVRVSQPSNETHTLLREVFKDVNTSLSNSKITGLFSKL